MIKNSFPVKLILRPSEAFADLGSGAAGWGWPLGLFALAAVSSAALLALVPPAFLAEAAAGLPPKSGSFSAYLPAGLAGGALFALFSCALLAGFSRLLASGRLMFRVPLPAAAVAAYAFFFVARHNAGAAGPSGWLAAAAALGMAALAAFRAGGAYPALLKAFLSLSVFALLGDACGAVAALAGSAALYTGAEYAFSFLSIAWLARAVCVICGVSVPRAFAAAIPALLGAAAFAFSLMTLGLIPADMFQLMLMM